MLYRDFGKILHVNDNFFFFLILGFLVEHIEYYNPKLGEKKEGKKKKKKKPAGPTSTLL